MDIKKTFLSLTTRTYPHKTEYQLFDKLPQNLDMDEFGNLFIKIGESDVMFTSHLDTATSALTEVNHVFDNNIIKTDGKSILGADDKAGVTIMIYMIKNNVPGLYYFFLGEEVGCIGSKKVAEKHKLDKLSYINKVVSFDRRGKDSVITFQAGTRCCSEEFAKELSKQLNAVEKTFNYSDDPTGVYTDSAQFVNIYPECTNISVGYYSEHTFSERQDIDYLIKLAKSCTKIDWCSLPVKRDPSETEYRSYGGYSNDSYKRYYDSNSDWGYSYSETGGKTSYKTLSLKTEKINFWDEEYRYISSIVVNKSTGELISIDLDKERILQEEDAIYDFLDDIELDYKSMTWDGFKLTVTYEDGRTTESIRQEMEEFLDCLDLSEMIIGDNLLQDEEELFL
jgi:hypothetical protein